MSQGYTSHKKCTRKIHLNLPTAHRKNSHITLGLGKVWGKEVNQLFKVYEHTRNASLIQLLGHNRDVSSMCLLVTTFFPVSKKCLLLVCNSFLHTDSESCSGLYRTLPLPASDNFALRVCLEVISCHQYI